MGIRLNLGSGQNPMSGYLNVDKYGHPDLSCDLETFPWPWPNNSVSEIQLLHVLEHLGASTETFINIMKEMYRVCEPGASIHIAVPHPRHDNFIGDPTHVRPIMPMTLQLFSRRANIYWQETKASNSPLALHHGVDFDLVHTNMVLEEPYASDFQSGKLSSQDVEQLIQRFNNVVRVIQLKLLVVKEKKYVSPESSVFAPESES